MRKIYAIILFVTIPLIPKAQTYLGSDACWTVFTHNMFTYKDYKNQYFLSGDTLINSKIYKKVIGRSPNNLQQQTYYMGAIREEAGKIFQQYTDFETNVISEYLLYDFNVKVGDTIHSTAPSGPLSRQPIVTKIDTIELQTGEKRKRFYFDSYIIWIEGIGCTGGFFLHNHEVLTNGDTPNLVCFKQNGIEYFKNESLCSDGTCCDVITGLEIPKLLNPTITLSPNPTNRFVLLDFSKSTNQCKSVKLLDALGNTLQRTTVVKNVDFRLDLLNYSKGLYFVVIEFEKKYELHKVIKL